MRKAEIANYLVSLNQLMTSQFHGASATPSPTLAAEYAKHWEMLRDKIKEDFNEARNGSESNERREDGASIESDLPGRGESAREHGKSRDDV